MLFVVTCLPAEVAVTDTWMWASAIHRHIDY